MDSQFFRVPTKPNYYESLTDVQSECIATKTAVSARDTTPTMDSRYPGWAAPMADGRLITDYRPHCNENVPAGAQYAVKEWIQENTDSIIEVSRIRQAKMTGAVYGNDPTVVPPPVAVVQCDPIGCSMAPTGRIDGIGTERVYDKSPELFGTFVLPRERAPHPNVSITSRFEGGRNSPRGRYYRDMGTSEVGKTALRGNF